MLLPPRPCPNYGALCCLAAAASRLDEGGEVPATTPPAQAQCIRPDKCVEKRIATNPYEPLPRTIQWQTHVSGVKDAGKDPISSASEADKQVPPYPSLSVP